MGELEVEGVVRASMRCEQCSADSEVEEGQADWLVKPSSYSAALCASRRGAFLVGDRGICWQDNACFIPAVWLPFVPAAKSIKLYSGNRVRGDGAQPGGCIKL